MVRPDNLESHHPYTRQGKSAGGTLRLLPDMSAKEAELGNVHPNGKLTPDIDPDKLRDEYLLDPKIYGHNPQFRDFRKS